MIIKRVVLPEQEVYDGFNPQAMKPNGAQIVKDVENYKGKDYENKFNGVKLVNYAMQKYRECENCYTFCYGLADTIIKQEIRNCQIKNGDKYFEDSTSKSSMVAVSNRMYETGKDGDINLFHCGSGGDININGDVVSTNFKDTNPTVLTVDEYSTKYGRTLDEMFIYLICDDTTKTQEVKKENNNYIVNLELDPDFSTYFYKLQMYNISGLDCLPSFSAVHLTFSLDANLMLKTLHIEEDYTATMMVPAATHGSLDYYYFPNEFLQIPELNEPLTYHKR